MPHVEDRWLRPGRYGKGRRWRARYTDPDGKERSRSFDKKSMLIGSSLRSSTAS